MGQKYTCRCLRFARCSITSWFVFLLGNHDIERNVFYLFCAELRSRQLPGFDSHSSQAYEPKVSHSSRRD